jgi:hypothetical protein
MSHLGDWQSLDRQGGQRTAHLFEVPSGATDTSDMFEADLDETFETLETVNYEWISSVGVETTMASPFVQTALDF